MKKLLLALALLLASSVAFAQCNGVFPANTVCGNLTGSPAPPSAVTFGGTITGPGTTVVGNIVTWANITGTQLGAGLGLGTGLASGGGNLNLQPAQPSVIGGTESITCSASTWVASISTLGVPTCAGVAAASANTMQGNWSGSSSAPIANTMPSCADSGGNHLNYVNGTGVTCGTSSGTLVAPQAGRFLPSLAGACAVSSPFTCMQFCQYKGNLILINGALLTIPTGQCVGSAGGIITVYNNACIENSSFVTTCAQTLAANTLYYAYDGLVTGTQTIIWSTNHHCPSLDACTSPNGNEIMTGDATRSLIGVCQTDGAGKFTGTAASQNCTSWFNPVFDGLQATVTSAFSGGAYVGLTPYLTYTQFSDNVPTVHADCVLALQSGGPINPTIGIGISTTGSVPTLPAVTSQITVESTSTLRQASVSSSGAIGAEGYVIAELLGLSQSGIQTNVTSCILSAPARIPS